MWKDATLVLDSSSSDCQQIVRLIDSCSETPEGKARVSRHGYKGGTRAILRELARVLRALAMATVVRRGSRSSDFDVVHLRIVT